MITDDKTENSTPEKVASRNIDLEKIANLIWKNKKFLYRYLVVFFLIGIFFAFCSPIEYKCEISILPEISNTKNAAGGLLKQFGNIGNLMGLGQMDLGSTDAIRPEIYPDILSSKPFLIHLMNYKIKCENCDSLITLYSYFLNYKHLSVIEYIKNYSVGLPGLIIDKLTQKGSKNIPQVNINDSILKLTYPEEKFLKLLEDKIDAKTNPESGIMTITVIMPEAKLSAVIANETSRFLTDYVKRYRIEKSEDELKFVEERLNEAKKAYIEVQMKLAKFQDENTNIMLASYKAKQDQLNSDFNIAFNVYNTLAQQYEQSKIKVEQEMPVIKILNPPAEPSKKFKPQRILILLISIFVGFIVSASLIIYRNYFPNKN